MAVRCYRPARARSMCRQPVPAGAAAWRRPCGDPRSRPVPAAGRWAGRPPARSPAWRQRLSDAERLWVAAWLALWLLAGLSGAREPQVEGLVAGREMQARRVDAAQCPAIEGLALVHKDGGRRVGRAENGAARGAADDNAG